MLFPVVAKPIEFPNGVRLSPDRSLLTVSDTRGRWVWSFQVQPDGALANGQLFYRLEGSEEAWATIADGMTLDVECHLYVATRLGVQICDQEGRVVGIINKPRLSNVVFGGPNHDMLYVTARDRVFRRHMRRKGLVPWESVKPPAP